MEKTGKNPRSEETKSVGGDEIWDLGWSRTIIIANEISDPRSEGTKSQPQSARTPNHKSTIHPKTRQDIE